MYSGPPPQYIHVHVSSLSKTKFFFFLDLMNMANIHHQFVVVSVVGDMASAF